MLKKCLLLFFIIILCYIDYGRWYMEDLTNILKKYVAIFVNEYGDYLSKEKLESLKEINYEDAIKEEDMNNPFGLISLGRICFSNISNELIDNLKNMPNYNTKKSLLHNKNLSSYLKYMCDNGYQKEDYYEDILMYFVFRLVIKNKSSFINGLINQEIKYLSIKYSIRAASLYPREEAIISKITPFLGIDAIRKILFMDKPTAFKYLNDNYGYRYAFFIDEIERLIDEEFNNSIKEEYPGYQGFLDYTIDYDNVSYGDVYNHILDFQVENNLIN